jgi:hypothetical protein
MLLGTSQGFQKDGGHPVQNIAGAAAPRSKQDQPASGCSPEASL